MVNGMPRSRASVDASEKLSIAVIDTTVDAIQRLNDLSVSGSELVSASGNCLATGTTENATAAKVAAEII